MTHTKLNIHNITEALVLRDIVEPDIVFYDVTDSTNQRAREWAREGRGEAIFIARSQSAGRGRLGRSFLSDEGGIYLSMLVYPEKRLNTPAKITAEAAVRLSHAVERLTGVSPEIKWVNDLYKNGKKIAGILTEGEFDESGNLRYYILGLGINVYKIDDFSTKMPVATTLEELTNLEININDLCAEIIVELRRPSSPLELLSEYRERCIVPGREVTVIRGNDEYSARAVSITDDYGLMVIRPNGQREVLSSGEISLRL